MEPIVLSQFNQLYLKNYFEFFKSEKVAFILVKALQNKLMMFLKKKLMMKFPPPMTLISFINCE